MQKIHTHYDNLKVSRNAPLEVIRAAYKVLSQKYHPDKTQGDADNTRIMAIINKSYDVLSDQNKRAEHDKWIIKTEIENQNIKTSTDNGENDLRPSLIFSAYNFTKNIFFKLFRIVPILILIGFIGAVVIPIFDEKKSSQIKPDSTETAKSKTTSVSSNKYIKPVNSPNGIKWPTKSGYVSGYPKLNTHGLSSVTIDNSQNNSDVFVKLVYLNEKHTSLVRQFYIMSSDKFTLKNVSPGNYDIRYRNLITGNLSRTEPFVLKEITTPKGTKFDNITMTIYKVHDGNMQTYGLSESEF